MDINLEKIQSTISSTGYVIWRVATIWRREIENKLKIFDLTHPQYVILTNIASFTLAGEKPSQVEIANKANIDVATTSQIIKHLEKKKLIMRNFIEGNDRSKYPDLTEGGIKILNLATPIVEGIDKQFFAKLTIDGGLIEDLKSLITVNVNYAKSHN